MQSRSIDGIHYGPNPRKRSTAPCAPFRHLTRKVLRSVPPSNGFFVSGNAGRRVQKFQHGQRTTLPPDLSLTLGMTAATSLESRAENRAVRVTHLDPSAYRRMPWKNGLGVTTEIARSPRDGDFDWRVSIAQVAMNGPFSLFPGCTRIILALDGAGMILTAGAHPEVALGPLEPWTFSGDVQTTCVLRDGPFRDFNVIARERHSFLRCRSFDRPLARRSMRRPGLPSSIAPREQPLSRPVERLHFHATKLSSSNSPPTRASASRSARRTRRR